MAQCNILEALRYVEGLYDAVPGNKENAANKKALRLLFEDINEQRAYLQQIASFANVKPLDASRELDIPVIEADKDLPPWMADPDNFVENIKTSYSEFATKVIEFVKSKKQTKVAMSKQLAIDVLVDPTTSFASMVVEGLNQSKITYPDFSAVINDEKSINKIAKKLKISTEDVVAAAVEHRKGEFLSMTKLHEHIHVGAIEFMNRNPNDKKTKYINNLYKKMLKLADTTNPSLNDIQNGYWKENVDEFVAVALSNPDLMEVLNNMPATGFVSTLHKLVNTLSEMVGIRQGSENQALLNIFTEMTEVVMEEDPMIGTMISNQQSSIFQGIPLGELNDIINEVNKCKSGN